MYEIRVQWAAKNGRQVDKALRRETAARPHRYGSLAQLVECALSMREAPGSKPGRSSPILAADAAFSLFHHSAFRCVLPGTVSSRACAPTHSPFISATTQYTTRTPCRVHALSFPHPHPTCRSMSEFSVLPRSPYLSSLYHPTPQNTRRTLELLHAHYLCRIVNSKYSFHLSPNS